MNKKENNFSLYLIWAIAVALILASRTVYDDINSNDYPITTVILIILLLVFVIIIIGSLTSLLKKASKSQKELRDKFPQGTV